MNLFRRVTGHLSTITRHKIKVTQLCFKMGLYKQGLLHDLSKYRKSEDVSGNRKITAIQVLCMDA